MISSERYRPSMEITLADIFQDFNDPRKQALMKRVAIAMECLEKKLKNELDANNLANLQILIKKQQALRNMEDKMNQSLQQNQQLKLKETIYANKIQELQAEANKKQQIYKTSEDRLKSLSDSVKMLQKTIKAKQTSQSTWQQDKANLLQENERLQMEKQKYELLIKKLKNTYSQKLEQTEFMLKVKEKKLAQTFNESLEKLKVKSLYEQEKKELEGISKVPKSDKRSEKIQVNMSNSPLTNRSSARKAHDFGTQTQVTQQRRIGQAIEQNINIHINNNQNLKKQEQTIQLEEVRLMYLKTPISSPPVPDKQPTKVKPETPKIAKCFSVITKHQVAQTETVRFKQQSPIRIERSCQAQADSLQQTRASIFQMEQEFRSQIREMTAKYEKMEEFHQQRYWEIVKIYEERPSLESDLKEIEMLKLNILSLKLQIEKKQEERSKQREIFSKVNEDLSKTQNQNLLNRVSARIGQKLFFNRKSKQMAKTSNMFYESSSRKAMTHTSQNHRTYKKSTWDDNQQDTIDFTLLKSKRLSESQEQELITVLKGDSTIKFVVGKKNSAKSTCTYEESITDVKMKRNYKKYSQLKKMNPFS